MAVFTRSRDNANNLLSPCVIWMILFSMTSMTTRVYGAGLITFSHFDTASFTNSDDGQHAVDLTEAPFTIAGQTYNHAYVGTNGQITFVSSVYEGKEAITSFPLPDPMITGLWTDNDLIRGGYVKVGLTKEFNDLDPLAGTIEIIDDTFEAYAALVVTWYGMKEFQTIATSSNIFQVALVRDETGHKTYAIFNYNSVQWGSGKEIGFNNGDNVNFQRLPGVDYFDIESSLVGNSNVGNGGRYVININEVVPEPSCDEGWSMNPSQDACYKAIKKWRRSFDDARTFCQNLGGDLATTAQRWQDRKHIRDLITFREHLWIGVEDPDTDGSYTFISSIPVVNPPFKRGRPRSGLNHCVTMKMRRWYDKKCSRKFPFVCEKAPMLP